MMKLLLFIGVIYCSQVRSLRIPFFNPIAIGTNAAQFGVNLAKQGADLGFDIAQGAVNAAQGITNAVLEHSHEDTGGTSDGFPFNPIKLASNAIDFGLDLAQGGANFGFNVADGALDVAEAITNTALEATIDGLEIFENGVDSMLLNINRAMNNILSGVNREMQEVAVQAQALALNPSEEQTRQLQGRVVDVLNKAQNSMQDIIGEIKKNTDVVISEGQFIAQQLPEETLAQVEKLANAIQNAIQQNQLSPERVTLDIQNEVEKTANEAVAE